MRDILLLTLTFLSIIILFCPLDSMGNKSFQEWNRTYGDLGVDFGSSIQETNDGGFIIAGANGGSSTARGTFGTGALDVWLIRTDSKGIEQWNRTYGGDGDDFALSVQETDDGGYVALGITESYGAGGVDIWLIKTDSKGIEEWNRTFGSEGFESGNSVLVADDGGYIIAGATASFGAGKTDLWLLKTDPQGLEEWNITFGGEETETASSFQLTDDKGCIIAGQAGSYGTGGQDVWLVKVDSIGQEEWNKTYGGAVNEVGNSVHKTSDGGFIITGETWSYGAGSRDVWLLKVNSSGQEEWNRTFGGAGGDAGGNVLQTADGGYLIAGWTESFGSGDSDAWLIKTDREGREEWSRTLGGSGFDEASSSLMADDGGYIICGQTDTDPGSIIFVHRDVWLIKLLPLTAEEYNETADTSMHRIITVGPAGYDYHSIMKAIDEADPGDTIEVYPGTYQEIVNVSKSLNLTGIGRPIVDAGENGNPITLKADGILMKGFVLRNSSKSRFWADGGIVIHSKDNIIEDNIARSNLVGILLADHSSRNLVQGNSVIHNNDSGILVRNSRFNTVRENEAHYNKNGIIIEHSSMENRIELNNASDNENGIGLDYSPANIIAGNNIINNTAGITSWSSSANIIYGNNLDNIEFDAIEASISNDNNQWDNGTVGNRYSSFDCMDLDGNGI